LKTKLKKETEAKEENDKSAGYEEELQKEEEKYLEYKEQIKLAKENGQDPANVEESYGAKEFQVGLYFLFSTGHRLKHLWGLISQPPLLCIMDMKKQSKGSVWEMLFFLVENPNFAKRVQTHYLLQTLSDLLVIYSFSQFSALCQ